MLLLALVDVYAHDAKPKVMTPERVSALFVCKVTPFSPFMQIINDVTMPHTLIFFKNVYYIGATFRKEELERAFCFLSS